MKIAVAQIACAVGDAAANVAKMRLFSERAQAAGADWIVFPEMADTGYVMPVIRAKAARWDEGAVPELEKIARELALGIIAGVSERANENCIFNSQIVIERKGEIVAKYRKMHLFAPIGEDECCSAGDDLMAIALGEFRAGLGICYDLRFPEFHRRLALDHGANLFVLSSAWPTPRAGHLRILSLARAIENQSYFILANRVGTDEGVTFCGGSMVIDPSGAALATADETDEDLLLAEISLDAVRTVRSRMPVFSHRRL